MPFPRVMVSGLNCIPAPLSAVGGRYPSLLAVFCSARCLAPSVSPHDRLLRVDCCREMLCSCATAPLVGACKLTLQRSWLWLAGQAVDLDPVPCPSAVLALQQQCGSGRALPSTHFIATTTSSPYFTSLPPSLPSRRVQRRRQGHRRLEQIGSHLPLQGRRRVQLQEEVQQGERLCVRADDLRPGDWCVAVIRLIRQSGWALLHVGVAGCWLAAVAAAAALQCVPPWVAWR